MSNPPAWPLASFCQGQVLTQAPLFCIHPYTICINSFRTRRSDAMLVLSRKENQRIKLGNSIVVTVVRLG
ncbi:MAG TPA: carbon storage regulator, partial [Pirellulales bacterium]